MALEKPGKRGDFFLLLCGHPVILTTTTPWMLLLSVCVCVYVRLLTAHGERAGGAAGNTIS